MTKSAKYYKIRYNEINLYCCNNDSRAHQAKIDAEGRYLILPVNARTPYGLLNYRVSSDPHFNRINCLLCDEPIIKESDIELVLNIYRLGGRSSLIDWLNKNGFIENKQC